MALTENTQDAGDPERTLALSYAPPDARAGLAALLALDDALAQLLRTTREPAIGQIRLAWWRERLAALDQAGAPAEPVLLGLATHLVPAGVRGAELVSIVDGWEILIEEVLDREALIRFGDQRGETLFRLAGRLRGGVPPAGAGAGWALADLARHLADIDIAAMARQLAEDALSRGLAKRWPGNLRALGALAHIARLDLTLPPDQPRPTGAPRRVGRMLWHRLTGR